MSKLKGFSVSWTITLILLGVFIGAVNVYSSHQEETRDDFNEHF